MKQKLPLIVSVIAVVAMCAFIFLMSNEPADDSTELSLGVAGHIASLFVPGYHQMPPDEQLILLKSIDHPIRKTAHFLEYALLGALFFNMFWQIAKARKKPGSLNGKPGFLDALTIYRPRQLIVMAWLSASAYAATDEIHQIFVPGRAGMPTDVLIDSAGTLVGALVASAVIHIVLRVRSESPRE